MQADGDSTKTNTLDFRRGDRVNLRALELKQNLNGKVGFVVGPAKKPGRICVQLEDSKRIVAVRPRNLGHLKSYDEWPLKKEEDYQNKFFDTLKKGASAESAEYFEDLRKQYFSIADKETQAKFLWNISQAMYGNRIDFDKPLHGQSSIPEAGVFASPLPKDIELLKLIERLNRIDTDIRNEAGVMNSFQQILHYEGATPFLPSLEIFVEDSDCEELLKNILEDIHSCATQAFLGLLIFVLQYGNDPVTEKNFKEQLGAPYGSRNAKFLKKLLKKSWLKNRIRACRRSSRPVTVGRVQILHDHFHIKSWDESYIKWLCETHLCPKGFEKVMSDCGKDVQNSLSWMQRLLLEACRVAGDGGSAQLKCLVLVSYQFIDKKRKELTPDSKVRWSAQMNCKCVLHHDSVPKGMQMGYNIAGDGEEPHMVSYGKKSNGSGPSIKLDHLCGNPACAKPKRNMKVCAACGKIKYCSRKCQEKHWKAHKPLCRRVCKSEKLGKKKKSRA